MLILLILTGTFLGFSSLLSDDGAPYATTTPDSSPDTRSSPPSLWDPSPDPTDDTSDPTASPHTDPTNNPADVTPDGSPSDEPGKSDPDPTDPGNPGNPTANPSTPTDPSSPDSSYHPTEDASHLQKPEDPEKWYLSTIRANFRHNSDEFIDKQAVKDDITSLLPHMEQLAGYVIVVQGSRELNEDSPNLPYLRAEAVSGVLKELGVPEASIRLNTIDAAPTVQKRNYADISFLEVGGK